MHTHVAVPWLCLSRVSLEIAVVIPWQTPGTTSSVCGLTPVLSLHFLRLRHRPQPRACSGCQRLQGPCLCCLLGWVRVSACLPQFLPPSCFSSGTLVPFCPPTLPSDPWAPEVTAVDLLFRGRRPFRRAPRAVFDATEQVGDPIAPSVEV